METAEFSTTTSLKLPVFQFHSSPRHLYVWESNFDINILGRLWNVRVKPQALNSQGNILWELDGKWNHEVKIKITCPLASTKHVHTVKHINSSVLLLTLGNGPWYTFGYLVLGMIHQGSFGSHILVHWKSMCDLCQTLRGDRYLRKEGRILQGAAMPNSFSYWMFHSVCQTVNWNCTVRFWMNSSVQVNPC